MGDMSCHVGLSGVLSLIYVFVDFHPLRVGDRRQPFCFAVDAGW